MTQKRIGVRTIVEFELKSGSIDERNSSSSEHTALEGTRIHQRLQKRAPKNYQKEVALKLPLTLTNGDTVMIDGRADGIIHDTKADRYLIDEIKTSETEFSQLEAGTLDLYWGQLKFYGYIFLKQHPQYSEIDLQLTYYQTLDRQITRTKETMDLQALTAFITPILEDYTGWLVFEADWQQKRQAAAKALKFPFAHFRTPQRQLAVSAYKTILAKTQLLVEAPTGTGKTMATLFPTIKAMGTTPVDRIFYFTAKESTRQVAEVALQKLQKSGAALKAVTLTAKDKICFLDERICTPEHCPFANGYFDRRKAGLKDILAHAQQLDRPTIEAYAKKHTLCPFEFSLDASLFSDVVICDYNYLFDPIVYLQRFFADQAKQSVFLVDEAHNLVARSRAMYTATIQDTLAISLVNTLEKVPEPDALTQKLTRRLNQVLDAFTLLTTTRPAEPDIDPKAPLDLIDRLNYFIEVAHDWLQDQSDTPLAKQSLDFYLQAIRFTRLYEYYDDTYRTQRQTRPDQTTEVKLLCFDPAKHIAADLNKGRASILFSATLSPMPYYRSVFGLPDSLTYRLASPFPKTNQRVLIPSYIQTTYRHREANLPKISASIYQLTQVKPGNYFVFCPSYALLAQVAADFEQRHPQIKTIQQKRQMNAQDRQAFLATFQTDPQETLVAFGILGGIFSEGIDLTGDRLIGVVVVSVGLPGLSPSRNALQTYFDHKNNQGFAYAYQLPGMNHVLQAAGRLIRQATDQGIVLLLDQRFLRPDYQQYFPAHWTTQCQVVHNPRALTQAATDFWHQAQEAHDENPRN